MPSRTFFGRILPERALVQIPAMELGIASSSNDLPLTVHLAVIDSQIVVTTDEVLDEDPLTERNIIAEITSLWTDLIAWKQGIGLSVDIVGVGGPAPNSRQVFPLQTPIIGTFERSPPANDIQIIDDLLLSDPERLRPLRWALSDFRRSITDPTDTPFHCFRAVESLAYYFGRNPRLGTPELLKALNITKKWLEKNLKIPAGEIRHGKIRPVTDKERQDAFRSASLVIERFIVLVHRRLTNLPENEFPILQLEPE